MGGRDSRAYAINDRGQIVGESMVEGGTFHAFLWENGQMSDLGTFGGKRSHAMAINDRGQIVGKKCSPSWLGKCRTFLWQDGKTISLEGLPARAIAADLNNRGEVVGCIDTGRRDDEEGDPISHAFIWQDGKLRDLGVLSREDDNSWAEAINDRGQVVGESWDVLPHGGAVGRAFMWRRGIMSALRPLPAFSARCEGLDVNGRGSVVGSCTDFFHDRGVLWKLRR